MTAPQPPQGPPQGTSERKRTVKKPTVKPRADQAPDPDGETADGTLAGIHPPTFTNFDEMPIILFCRIGRERRFRRLQLLM